MKKILFPLLILSLILLVSPVSAGNILFVSDDGSDNNIPSALSVDGHTVTTTPIRSALSGDLSSYCAVFWSASDDAEGGADLSGIINNLTSYVNSGGHVFVTGADSVASAVNADMLNFVGGSGGFDSGDVSGPVVNTINSLTTGVIDIRGQIPSNAGDGDTLCGPLLPGTTGIVASSYVSCTGYVWTLRELGLGEVAWVGSGNFDNAANYPDWTNTTIPGDGVYNGALRNFAHNACLADNSIPTLNTWGMIIFMVLAGLSSVYYLRRKKIEL